MSGDDDFPQEGVATLVREGHVAPIARLATLLVIRGSEVATHPLPDRGAVSIGRGELNDVCVGDPSVSRRHAALRIGDEGATIEDLGSANGTRVRGARLQPGERVAIAPDEPIEVGSVMLIVQQRAEPVRTRRLWSHDYFEGRLADECARAERFGSEFALVRVRCDHSVPQETVLDVFGRVLRDIDLCGLYAPGDYELLLTDTPRAAADAPLRRMSDELARRGVKVTIGCAFYPGDARDPDSLVAKAHGDADRAGSDDADRIVVTEGAMQRLHHLVERIAAGTLSVLIAGETGVGKELMAEAVHKLSPRASRPFLRLNCAALSESLLESELFGHERGAFTGAVQTKLGLLETADGGTVFLDELGEMPMATQVKLLRVIESRQVQRVGALKPRSIDVRFVAATNRDLEAEIARGTFRQDLYFRLNGVTLSIPPLRHRVGEIPGLARVFLVAACRHTGRAAPPAIGADAMKLLQQYSWPGNIRELRNVIERAVLLCDGADAITPEHLPVQKMKATFSTRLPIPPEVLAFAAAQAQVAPSLAGARPVARDFRHDERTGQTTLPGHEPAGEVDAPAPRGMREEIEAIERRKILEALEQCGGNQTEAAKRLGISRRTLINRLESYELPRPRKRRAPR